MLRKYERDALLSFKKAIGVPIKYDLLIIKMNKLQKKLKQTEKVYLSKIVDLENQIKIISDQIEGVIS